MYFFEGIRRVNCISKVWKVYLVIETMHMLYVLGHDNKNDNK
jgi:hypothetical protein